MALQEKPEPKVLTQPVGVTVSKHIRINSLKEANQAQEKQEENAVTWRNDFDIDDLKRHWRIYAQRLKADGRETVFSAMMRRDPELLEDYKISISVDNTVQASSLEHEKADILMYFRRELKNFAIDMEVKQAEQAEIEQVYMSGADKFKSMARKNPNLHTFKRIFNLDIEL